MFVRDPCGIVCVIFTYLAIFYADYVVTRWILLETLQDRYSTPPKVTIVHALTLRPLLLSQHIRSDPCDAVQ